MNDIYKILTVTGIFLLSIPLTSGQSAVLTSGDNIKGSGGSVSYSIGQVDYKYYGGEIGSINLGVQQPNLFIMVGTDESQIQVSANLFPNPATESAYLELKEETNTDYNGLSYSLFNMNGQLILHDKITASLTTISIAHLPSTTYLLRVMRDEHEIKSMKIFKTQ